MRLKTCRVDKGGCGKTFKTPLNTPFKCPDCNTRTNKKLVKKALINRLLVLDEKLYRCVERKMNLENRRRKVLKLLNEDEVVEYKKIYDAK